MSNENISQRRKVAAKHLSALKAQFPFSPTKQLEDQRRKRRGFDSYWSRYEVQA